MTTPPRRPPLMLYLGIVAVVALPVFWRLRGEPERQGTAVLPTESGEGTGKGGDKGATTAEPAPRPSAALPHLPAPPPPSPPPSASATLARVRDVVRTNPDQALALLDALDRAHPGGNDADAEERAALRVDALVFAQRIGVARDTAEVFLQRYPRGARAQHVEMLTGVHPHPAEPAD